MLNRKILCLISRLLSSFFRPELLQSTGQQYSPDTYFPCQRNDPLNSEMRQVHSDLHEKLLREIIPSFVSKLTSSSTEIERLIKGRYRIASNMHRAGINLRYLPQIIQHLPDHRSAQARFVVELLARALKNALSAGLREKESSVKSAHKYVAWFFTHAIEFLSNKDSLNPATPPQADSSKAFLDTLRKDSKEVKGPIARAGAGSSGAGERKEDDNVPGGG